MTSLVPAPPGYAVDFENPQRLANIAAYWCFGVGGSLSLLFTAQRIYVKMALKLPWQVDDALLAISWITSMAVQAIVISGFALGVIGVHAWEVTLEHINATYVSVWIVAPTYIIAGSCTKMALLVCYLRVSPQQWLRYSVFTTMFVITGYTTAIFFALIFACTPIRKSFDVTVTEGQCLSNGALYMATAVCNIISDAILFVLPIPMLCRLQMPLKQKLGAFFIFGIGSVTVITSIMRAVLLPTLLTTNDVTWRTAPASLLILVESNLIIICGMLPTLRKFFALVAPKLLGESVCSKDGNNVKASGVKHSALGPKPPHLVTFGSLPVQSRRYTKCSSGHSNDGLPLATMDANGAERPSCEMNGGVGAANARSGPEIGRDGWDRVGEESLKRSSAGSQIPIVTTRIEVSNNSTVGAPPGRGTDAAF